MSFNEPTYRQQLCEDWRAHGRDWTKPGFRAIAVHRFGNWALASKSRVIRKLLWLIYLSLFRYIRNHYGIEVPFSTSIGRRVILGHQTGIVIHPYSEIGDDCLIRQNVTIGAVSDERFDDAPILGNGVSVGCGAVILGKVKIGTNAVIGPNVVVMSDVPPNAKVFADPPRVMQISRGLVKSHDRSRTGQQP
ncbi:MAG: serine acetyltransferase [Nitrospira sp.]|nr:serine acetyltransferase [Nitrospira sp.]